MLSSFVGFEGGPIEKQLFGKDKNALHTRSSDGVEIYVKLFGYFQIYLQKAFKQKSSCLGKIRMHTDVVTQHLIVVYHIFTLFTFSLGRFDENENKVHTYSSRIC